jgi:hypothetical protein
MQYVGIDYHKRYIMITKMDGRGKIIEQLRLTNIPDFLKKFNYLIFCYFFSKLSKLGFK